MNGGIVRNRLLFNFNRGVPEVSVTDELPKTKSGRKPSTNKKQRLLVLMTIFERLGDERFTYSEIGQLVGYAGEQGGAYVVRDVKWLIKNGYIKIIGKHYSPNKRVKVLKSAQDLYEAPVSNRRHKTKRTKLSAKDLATGNLGGSKNVLASAAPVKLEPPVEQSSVDDDFVAKSLGEAKGRVATDVILDFLATNPEDKSVFGLIKFIRER